MTPARQAALLPTARAGGCTPGKPPSCLRQGRGVAPQASRLLACGKGGGCTPGESPSCLRQGREAQDENAGKTREREGAVPTARAPASGPKREKKCRVTPAGQAAFLPTARAGGPRRKRGENTRTRGSRFHSPSASERPQARNEILCQAFL